MRAVCFLYFHFKQYSVSRSIGLMRHAHVVHPNNDDTRHKRKTSKRSKKKSSDIRLSLFVFYSSFFLFFFFLFYTHLFGFSVHFVSTSSHILQ